VGAIADGSVEYRRHQVMVNLLASSPGFIERYLCNRLLGSSPEEAALGAILAGGLAAEHVLQLQGDSRDLQVARAHKNVKAVAKVLADLVEENLDRTIDAVMGESQTPH
jgi:hypothetical protein